MHDLADAANDLAALLEAAAPREGLTARRHSRIIKPARRRIERVLLSYFQRQEAALLAEIKPKIAARESLTSSAKTSDNIRRNYKNDDGIGLTGVSSGGHLYANAILPTSIHPLRFPVTSVETEEYNDAMAEVIRGAVASMKAGAVGQDFASIWLRDNSLTKLTGDFSTTSINRLRDAMADAWDAGGSFNQIVSAIQETFADFSDSRAAMIAQTEVNDAYNSGRLATAVAAGFDQKAWDPDGEACEICLGNVDAGWIGIDDDFPSGDMAPTAHPNCDCSVDFQKGAD